MACNLQPKKNLICTTIQTMNILPRGQKWNFFFNGSSFHSERVLCRFLKEVQSLFFAPLLCIAIEKRLARLRGGAAESWMVANDARTHDFCARIVFPREAAAAAGGKSEKPKKKKNQ